MTCCYKVSSDEILIVTNDRGNIVATLCNLAKGTYVDLPVPSSRVSSIISHCPKVGGFTQ